MPTTTGNATQLITFSRGSLATVTDADGKIKWAPHNLLLASEQFDASSWARTGVNSVSANAVSAPNGTTTADALLETTGSEVHRLEQTISTASGVKHTISCWMKGNGRTWGIVQFSVGATDGYAYFNLDTGVPGTVGAGASNVSISRNATTGWCLCSLDVTSTATSVKFAVEPRAADGGGAYAGDTTKGLYLWGASVSRSDLGGMQANASAYPMYNPSTPRNLLGWSEDFSNATWNAVTNATVSTNAGAAPNGSQTADLIYPASSGSNRQRYQAVTGQTSGTRYTVSIYLKSSSMQWIAMLSPNGANFGCYFDLVNGIKGTEASGVTGSITPLGDGWYRCSVSQVSSATTIYCGISFADANGGTSVTASGTSGVLAWGAQLSDSASLDPYVGSYGAAPSAAAAHGPRLDYDPVTLAARGLLVEEQRANLVLQSAAFDSASWNKIAVGTASAPVVTANNAISPDGTQTADLVVFDRGAGTSGDRSVLSQSPSTSAGTYTQSVWLKAATAGDIGKEVALRNVAGGAYLVVTLTASWVRYTRTEVWASNNWEICNRQGITADVTVSVHVWGAQLELGSFATSYIPTAAATVTRNADVASVATSQFPYSASASSLVVSASLLAVNVGGQFVAALSDNTLNNRIALFNGSGSANVSQIVTTGGATQSFINTGSVAAGSVFKVGTAVTTNDAAAYLNGAAGTPDTTVTMPPASVLYIGADEIGTARLNGHIRQITYIPRRLANADLQARTV